MIRCSLPLRIPLKFLGGWSIDEFFDRSLDPADSGIALVTCLNDLAKLKCSGMLSTLAWNLLIPKYRTSSVEAEVDVEA